MTGSSIYGQQQQQGNNFNMGGFNRTSSFYGQPMAPGTNMNRTMPNPQQNNIYGMQPQQSNSNVYGNQVMNNNPQTNSNYNLLQKQQQPENDMKNILIASAREKMEGR